MSKPLVGEDSDGFRARMKAMGPPEVGASARTACYVMTERCRHGKTWIMCSGWLEWCYECGAVRQLELVEGTNASKTKGKWIRPVGKGGKNPYAKLST